MLKLSFYNAIKTNRGVNIGLQFIYSSDSIPTSYAGGFALSLTVLEISIYVCAALILLAVLAFPIIAIARASKPSEEE